MSTPRKLKELPIQRNRPLIIDNFELNGVKSQFNYILEGDKIYYSRKGQDRWFDEYYICFPELSNYLI